MIFACALKAKTNKVIHVLYKNILYGRLACNALSGTQNRVNYCHFLGYLYMLLAYMYEDLSGRL